MREMGGLQSEPGAPKRREVVRSDSCCPISDVRPLALKGAKELGSFPRVKRPGSDIRPPKSGQLLGQRKRCEGAKRFGTL